MEKVTGSSPVLPTMFMHTVYVLKSLKNGKRYVGYTSKDLKDRLAWHRWGLTDWSKENGPFKLLHYEEFEDKVRALKREQYLKTGQGRRTMDLLLKTGARAQFAP